MARELQDSKNERDALRRRLQETSERHVELTRRLRKQQMANKSLDEELWLGMAAKCGLEEPNA